MHRPYHSAALQLHLFDPEDDSPIRFGEFLRGYVMEWLARNDLSPETIDEYRESGELFLALLDGDPVLDTVGRAHFDLFKQRLQRVPARRPPQPAGESYRDFIWQCIEPRPRSGESADEFAKRAAWIEAQPRLSQNTRRKHCTAINRILQLAGPPKFEDDEAAGLLKHAPRMRPPALEVDENVDVYSTTEFSQWLAACASAKVPKERYTGFPPPLWWSCLLPFLRQAGPRVSTAMKAEWTWIEGSWLKVPKWGIKRRQAKPFYLRPEALAAIEPLRRPAGRIFGWPKLWPEGQSWLNSCCKRTQEAAGLPPERWIGMHALRATCATELLIETRDVELVRRQLGHTKAAVAFGHYLTNEAVVEAIRQRLKE